MIYLAHHARPERAKPQRIRALLVVWLASPPLPVASDDALVQDVVSEAISQHTSVIMKPYLKLPTSSVICGVRP